MLFVILFQHFLEKYFMFGTRFSFAKRILANFSAFKLVYISLAFMLLGTTFPGIFNLTTETVSLFPPRLVTANYKGFNIIAYGNKFYGLSQYLGVIDLTKLGEEENMLDECLETEQCVITYSIQEAIEFINEATPELVEAGYNGFDIIRYKDKFYVLDQTLGVEPTRLNPVRIEEYRVLCTQILSPCAITNSLEEAKTFINQHHS